MGRAEMRRWTRKNKIEERKGKMLMTKQELKEYEDAVRNDISTYNVEALMTCIAIAEHRLYGFGQTRVTRTLNYIDELMGEVLNGNKTIEDYKKIADEEVGVIIKCK